MTRVEQAATVAKTKADPRIDVPELKDLGRNIAAARRGRGITQSDLSVRCGLSQGSISAIESGRHRPALDQFFRIARALGVPLQRLIDDRDRPGGELPDIAIQLRSLGIVDLWVRDAKVPGAFAWTEEVIALAARGDDPDPRVIMALPAVLAWNEWDSALLEFFSRRIEMVQVSLDGDPSEREIRARENEARRRVINRLAWMADIALSIDRRRGFPGGCLGRQLSQLVRGLPPRPRSDAWDGLGRPMTQEPRSPIWRRWRINFDADIKEFEKRAEQLVELGGGMRRDQP